MPFGPGQRLLSNAVQRRKTKGDGFWVRFTGKLPKMRLQSSRFSLDSLQTERAISSRSLLPKTLVVLAFSFIWFIIAVGKTRQHIGLPNLDSDWLMSLAAMFQQGSVIGRDFHFTYGPVAQILAWLGAGSKPVFEVYPLIVLAWFVTTILVFATVVLCIPELGPLYTAFLYLAIGVFNFFLDVPGFRMLLVLLVVVAIARSVTSGTDTGRRIWSTVGGAFCIVAQLTTVELGLYAVAAATALCLIYIVRARRSGIKAALHGPLETLFMVWGIYVGGNLAVDALFWLSGEHYSFFDYQRYALEIIKGYSYGMVLPWELNRWRTGGLLVVTVFTLGAVLVMAMRDRLSASAQAILLGMSLALLLCLKSTLIRSGTDHIVLGMTPMVVTFLVVGRWVLPGLQQRIRYWTHPAIWICMLVVLRISWPMKSTAITDLKLGTEALASGLLTTLRNPGTPEKVLPAAVLRNLQSGGPKPILNFPYENHIGILLNRRLVAPVLQSYVANTIALQQYYVASLDRVANRDMDVAYSVDGIASWAVDGVQAISRVPIIFEYLYRNFELRDYSDGLMVLQRSREPRTQSFHELSFKTTASQASRARIQLTQPTSCGLVRLQMQVSYSPMVLLTKPVPIYITVRNGEESLTYSTFVPLALGSPFSTFFSVVPPDLYFNVFGQGSVPSRMWDRLDITAPAWRFAVPPRRLHISRLECMDSERFVILAH